MIEVRDPKTGAKVRWSCGANAVPGAMPSVAAVPGRDASRRFYPVEHPDCAVRFGDHLWLAYTGWDGLTRKLARFDPVAHALIDVPISLGQLSSANSVEDRQITPAHRVPQIASTPNELGVYCVCNTTTQGAGASWTLRRVAADGTVTSPATFVMTTPAHWDHGGVAVPKINSSAVASGYYYGCRALAIGAGADRVLIPGLVNTAAASHAAVMYSDNFDTAANSAVTTWKLVPLILSDGDNAPVMSHLAAHSVADGAADGMLVGAVTNLYGRDFLAIVYSEDDGATWQVAGKTAEQGDYAIPAGDGDPTGGLGSDHAEFTARLPWADGGAAACVHRIIYDATAQTAWVSLVIGDTDSGYGEPPDSTAACYLLKIDMTARATTGCVQTLHGPYLADAHRSFHAGMQLIDDDEDLIVIVGMPAASASPIVGETEKYDCGPTLRIYSLPKTDPGTDEDVDWTLVHTVTLPAGGSPCAYQGMGNDEIRHQWGYPPQQSFGGILAVDGDPSAAFVLVTDQKISNVPQVYHIARVGVLDVPTGVVADSTGTPTGSQVVVPTNVGILGGHRGALCYGVEDWREELNIGTGPMSIVLYFSVAGSLANAPDMPLIGSTDFFGLPIVSFCEMRGQATPLSATPETNSPKNGWGVWHNAAGIALWLFANFAGGDTVDNDDATKNTFRVLRLNGVETAAAVGSWHRLCIVKEANAASDNAFWAYLNGAFAGRIHYGDCMAPGSVAESAKLRWGHHVNSYSEIVALGPVAAGVWIYGAAMTATQAANLTKAPGASGQIDPLDASIAGDLIARNYSGVPDWRSLGSAGRGSARGGLRASLIGF